MDTTARAGNIVPESPLPASTGSLPRAGTGRFVGLGRFIGEFEVACA